MSPDDVLRELAQVTDDRPRPTAGRRLPIDERRTHEAARRRRPRPGRAPRTSRSSRGLEPGGSQITALAQHAGRQQAGPQLAGARGRVARLRAHARPTPPTVGRVRVELTDDGGARSVSRRSRSPLGSPREIEDRWGSAARGRRCASVCAASPRTSSVHARMAGWIDGERQPPRRCHDRGRSARRRRGRTGPGRRRHAAARPLPRPRTELAGVQPARARTGRGPERCRCSSAPTSSRSSPATSTSSSWCGSRASSAASPPGSPCRPTSGALRSTCSPTSARRRTSCRTGTRAPSSELVKPALDEAGIHIESWSDLDETDRERIDEIFSAQIFPVLMPLAVDPAHPVPLHLGAVAQPVDPGAQPEDRQGGVRAPQGAAEPAALRAAAATTRAACCASSRSKT